MTFLLSGNGTCILDLTKRKKNLGLKPSFTNLLILLVLLINYKACKSSLLEKCNIVSAKLINTQFN